MIANLLHVRNSRRGHKGFTLIELLVTVLILAVLMAVALPLYLSAVADSELKTCRANMQTIANSVQSARVKANDPDFSRLVALPIATVNEPDLLTVPKCPNGGAYTIAVGASNTATFQIACSVAAHGKFEAGVDSK